MNNHKEGIKFFQNFMPRLKLRNHQLLKVSRFLLVLVLISAWMYSDLPQFFGFPPAVSEAKAAILEASATANITTTSTTYTLMTSMTLTPGAGDYLAVFSTSVRGDTASSFIRVSIFVNGVQQAHTEREIFVEASKPNTDTLLATAAHVTVGAGQAVEIRWLTTAGTATGKQRTFNLFPVALADVSQATATADATTASATDVLLTGMTLTPGAGDYVALFSTSADGPSATRLAFSIYVGGVKVAHTERTNDQEPSIPNTEFTAFIGAKVSPTAGQAVEVRWSRQAGTGTITAHERTLTLYKTDAANIVEASATADATATNTTDALLTGMTLTSGAGDYVAIYSGSHRYGTIGANIATFFTLYVNGVPTTDTERNAAMDASLDNADVYHMTNGVVSPSAGQAVEVRWRADATDLRTVHERTLVLLREVVAAPGDFNAFETSTGTTATGVIKTKIAGAPVSFDIIALNADRKTINTTFTGTVRVEVLNSSSNTGGTWDGNGCYSTWTAIQTLSPDPQFVSNGRLTISFTQANSYPDVRLRITYPAGAPTKTGCSNDNFAIRPNTFGNFAVTDTDWQTAGTGRALNDVTFGTVTHKAGRPLSGRATALNAAGTPATTTNYAGTPTAVPSVCVGAACTATFGTPGSMPFVAGQLATDVASYDNVGSFALQLVDSIFANVDAGDGSTATERNITSAVINVGRFVPDHFAVALNTPVFGGACGAFTYIGQAFNYATAPVITVTAQGFANNTTTLYATSGSWWRITNASLTGKAYTAAAGTLNTSGITGTDPVIADSGGGIGTLTFSSGTGLLFTRTTPVAPFDADVSLAINVIDADGVTYASNPASFGAATAGNGIAFSGGKPMRFGQLALGNALGSEVLNLPIPIQTQYWNGTSFVTNTLDSCTTITASNIVLSNYQGALTSGNLPSGNISIGGAFNAGVGNLKLTKPSSAVNGSVDLCVDLGGDATCVATPAGKTYLQGVWSGTTYTLDPRARAAFGFSKGSYSGGGRDPFVYQRENY